MRLVQLTALAYCIGFVTDVLDDGASARMDVVDGKLPGGRVPAEDLSEAMTNPVAPSRVIRDTDPEGQFITDEDIAAVKGFMPRACVHTVSDKRPKLTRGEQERTTKVINHVLKRLKASDDFSKLIHLVAMRESSLQQGLVHRLSPDLEGSYSAWRKMSKSYEGNPVAKDPTVWQTYGLFGMNSNYFTMVWDKAADPRVLCDAVVDVLVYRRSAARMLRKVSGQTIVCKDEKGRPYNYTTKATWETVHRAVSGGKLCPSKHEESAATMRKFFRNRAARVGLDPDKPVTAKMLGLEPDKALDGTRFESQEQMVMSLWTEFEAEQAKLKTEEETKEAKKLERIAARKRR